MGQRQQQKLMKGTSNHRVHLAWKLLERLRFYPKEMGLNILEAHLVSSRRYRINFGYFDKFQLIYDLFGIIPNFPTKGRSYQLGRMDLRIYR